MKMPPWGTNPSTPSAQKNPSEQQLGHSPWEPPQPGLQPSPADLSRIGALGSLPLISVDQPQQQLKPHRLSSYFCSILTAKAFWLCHPAVSGSHRAQLGRASPAQPQQHPTTPVSHHPPAPTHSSTMLAPVYWLSLATAQLPLLQR